MLLVMFTRDGVISLSKLHSLDNFYCIGIFIYTYF